MATHSSILAWRIPWIEEAGGLVHGFAKSQTQQFHFHMLMYMYTHTHTHYICQTYILCIQIFVVQMMVLKSGF